MAKKKIDKNFYINEIKVCEWLEDFEGNQIHRFSNRIEYKKNYKLHRIGGPAIEFHDNSNPKYYVEGVNYTEDEYKNFMRLERLKEIL